MSDRGDQFSAWDADILPKQKKPRKAESASSSSNAILKVPSAPKGHSIAELSTFSSQRSAIEEVHANAGEAMLKVTEAIDETNKMRDDAHLAINQAFETLQQALELRKTTLLSDLESASLSKTTALTLQKEKFENAVAASQILLAHTDDEITALGGLIHTELLKKVEPISLVSNTQSDICVDVQTDDLIKELSKFGCVWNVSLSSSASTWTSTSEAKEKTGFHVKIESKTSKGTAYPHGGLQVKAEMIFNNETVLHGEVEDHGDGTYTTTFIPQTAGCHQLLITLNGQHVHNSPHDLIVLPAHPNHNCSGLGKVQKLVKVPSGPTGIATYGDSLYVATYKGLYKFDKKGNPDPMNDNGLLFEGDRKKIYPSAESVIIKDEVVYYAKFGTIYRLTLKGDLINKFWANGTAGLVIDEYQRIFASNCSEGKIDVMNHNGGTLFTINGNVSGDHGFRSPYGLAFDPLGNIHVAASGCNTIKVFTKEGVYIRKYGDLKGPRGIAIDNKGYSFISEYAGNCISIFDPQGNKIHTIAGGSLYKPFGLALTSEGLYVASYEADVVLMYSICEKISYSKITSKIRF